MYGNKALVIGLFLFVVLFAFIPTSQAELWDFIIQLDVKKNTIHSGESIWITGKIVDHAYKPVTDAKIHVHVGTDTQTRFTNPDGEFRVEFSKFERMPGTYIANVIASKDGMMGITNIQFQVKGDMTNSALQNKLSTEEAKKYLNATASDFEKDPIGQTLYKYYQNLDEELTKEIEKANQPDEKQILLEKQRRISENFKNQEIKEFKPGAGIYHGYRSEHYLSGLDSEIRDLISNQLNFTKNNFLEAQSIRDEILANGGTQKEAREAYLDKITMSVKDLEQFNQEQLDKTPETTSDENKTQKDNP